MKFLFDDESFSFEALRTAGFAAYGGADLGEVLSTASHVGEGDEASWHQAWKATAQRVAESASRHSLVDTALAPEKPWCGRRTTTAPRGTSCSRSQLDCLGADEEF